MEGKSATSTPTRKKPKHSSSPASPQVPVREKPTTPYKLREASKLPSRYRDEPVEAIRTRSPNKGKTTPRSSTSSPARRAFGKNPEPAKTEKPTGSQPQQSASAVSSNQSQQGSVSNQSVTGTSDNSRGASSVRSESPLLVEETGKGPCPVPIINDVAYHNLAMRKSRSEREREVVGERVGLKRLKNVLSLRKARRWCICEFFYSAVDEQLFLAENEFNQIMSESFPNLKTNMLNRPQWRAVRRLMGKPRRCSPQFFAEERTSLEQKRGKIRAIYEGTYLTRPDYDISDLPMKLPRPLVVGMRVYARIHQPKDGIYGGTIDAVLKNGYRVIFEKEDMIPPLEVADCQVMLDGQLELVPITYFIEETTAKLPFAANRLGLQAGSSSMSMDRHDMAALAQNKMLRRAGAGGRVNAQQQQHAAVVRSADSNVDKVGNFPVRMLVILVKLSKLLDLKKRLVRQLTELNTEAEKANLLTNTYHPTFQEKYAQVVIDLESLNKQMSIYLQGIQEYNTQLMPHLTDNSIVKRPDALRRACHSHAQQIVKHCNQGLNVTHPRAISLITSLTSLLLQIRSLGQQKLTAVDLHSLSQSMNGIREMISPKNAAAFQDHCEVHMKQIHNMMVQSGALTR